jgi:hypothetical protein
VILHFAAGQFSELYQNHGRQRCLWHKPLSSFGQSDPISHLRLSGPGTPETAWLAGSRCISVQRRFVSVLCADGPADPFACSLAVATETVLFCTAGSSHCPPLVSARQDGDSGSPFLLMNQCCHWLRTALFQHCTAACCTAVGG